MNWINPLLDSYYDWLKSNTFTLEDEQTGWVSISTPFIGIFNNTIEIFAKKKGDKILLSDNGETIRNLELVGANVQRGERKNIINSILLNYGVVLSNAELVLESSYQDFPKKKHNFLSTLIELNDMYMLSNNKVNSIFKEDVRKYLDEQEIVYTADFLSRGKTGLEFNFDFQIAQKSQEIVLKSFSRMNKLTLSSFIFTWEDIKPVREKISKKEVKAIAVINDSKGIKEEYLEALTSKNTDYILWSEREKFENIAKIRA